MRCSQTYTLIILSVFIICKNIAIIKKTQNDRVKNDTELSFVLPHHDPRCYYQEQGFSFTLPNCKSYVIGSKIKLIGSVDEAAAKGFFQQKRLSVRTTELLPPQRFSVGVWFWKIQHLLADKKLKFCKILEQLLPEPEAGFICGVVFGGTASLPEEIQQNFRLTGLTHVLSASGYNVSVLAGLVMILLAGVPGRWLKVGLALTVIWSYVLMTGAGPPVLRAAIMLTINLVGVKLLFRQYHLLWSLWITALLMLILAPWYVRSLSFWLSLTATAGIILFLPILEGSQGIFWRWETSQVLPDLGEAGVNHQLLAQPATQAPIRLLFTRVWQTAKESLLVTLTAQLLTAPLILVTFGELSVISPVANTLLLWLTPLVTIGGLLLMLLGSGLQLLPLLWSVLAPTLAWLCWLPAHFFLEGVSWLGRFEWGLVSWQWSWAAVFLWWSGLIAWLIHFKREQFRENSLKRSV